MASKMFGGRIVKFDVDKDEVVRGKNGLCIECAPREVGELLGPIRPEVIFSRFDGYEDPAASKKKILTDVLAKGDKCVSLFLFIMYSFADSLPHGAPDTSGPVTL